MADDIEKRLNSKYWKSLEPISNFLHITDTNASAAARLHEHIKQPELILKEFERIHTKMLYLNDIQV